MLDEVFLALFSRYRRARPGSIEGAWRRAANRVSGLVLISMISLAICVISIGIKLFPAEIELSGKVRTAFQLVGGGLAVLIAVVLEGRFKSYLASPPNLAEAETAAEKSIIKSFTFCVSAVVIVCTAVAMALWN